MSAEELIIFLSEEEDIEKIFKLVLDVAKANGVIESYDKQSLEELMNDINEDLF